MLHGARKRTNKWRKDKLAKNEMNDQLRVRRQKMDEMRENGIEPFGQRKFDRQDLASTLEEK